MQTIKESWKVIFISLNIYLCLSLNNDHGLDVTIHEICALLLQYEKNDDLEEEFQLLSEQDEEFEDLI